jgi:hypothetical protein
MLEFATQLVMGLKDIALKIRRYKFRKRTCSIQDEYSKMENL